ncbi:HAD family hydrolase [Spiroplasma endosymbiont of 'Nebria riversi']|uniref:HAD family hydrolase n=1 Tax=Spiroplasma endosymbiont of 'Nebria riversi' TaxID=2792084 RepID=UPI001C050305|nr:HAD family hydrolase [Spiroplasma endosymbiont of 'Nebria riversi']
MKNIKLEKINGVMMKIKLVALDLDKTLLKNHFKLHPENIVAVKQAQELGVKVIIATGRSPQSSYKFARELGLYETSEHMVFFNGAYVINLRTGELLVDKEISSGAIKKIINLAKNYKVAFWGYSVDGNIGYILKKTFKIWLIQKLNRRKIVKVNENSDVRMYKILLLGKSKRINILALELEKLQIAEIAISEKGKSRMIEVNELNISKASGIKHLAKMWNINREEVMAIGDGMNDYKMIEWAGYGIAMKDSEKPLLAIANDITDTYNNGGVSKAIHKYILDIN